MTCFLLAGPIMLATERREARVLQMAAELVHLEALDTRADSVRALFWTNRYASVDISILVDDARAVAFQQIVAKEMSAS